MWYNIDAERFALFVAYFIQLRRVDFYHHYMPHAHNLYNNGRALAAVCLSAACLTQRQGNVLFIHNNILYA